MYPIAISIWRYHKKESWLRDLVSRAIVYFTGKPYTHVGVFMGGRHYDSTIWKMPQKVLPRSGPRITLGWPDDGRPDFCMVPTVTPSDDEVRRVSEALHERVNLSRPYNILKLVSLAIVWNTRWFWRKIEWVPFDHEMHGEVCSTFVDEVFMDAKWDLFPRHFEGYTVPGQFVDIAGWKRVTIGEVFPGEEL